MSARRPRQNPYLSSVVGVLGLTLMLAGCSENGIFDTAALRYAEFSWAYELILQIDGVDPSGSPVASAEEDVPVPLILTPDRVDYSAIRRDGMDLEISDVETDEVLPFEIEEWNPDGESVLWVRVPQIDPGPAGATIRVTYGRWDAGETYAPQEVWSNGYVAVYHFAEDGPPYLDSSSFENHTTDMITDVDDLTPPDAVDGFLGRGVTFATGSEFAGLRVPTSDSISNLTALSAEFVIDPDTELNAAMLFFKNGVRLRVSNKTQDILKFEQNFQSIPEADPVSVDWDPSAEFFNYGLAAGDWRIGSLVWDGRTDLDLVRAFRNGVSSAGPVGSSVPAGEWTIESNGDFDLILGNGERWNRGRPMEGRLDEFRLSNVARSESWAKLQAAALRDRLVDWDAAEETQLRDILQ